MLTRRTFAVMDGLCVMLDCRRFMLVVVTLCVRLGEGWKFDSA